MKTKIVYIIFFARLLCMMLQIIAIFIPFLANSDIFNHRYVFNALIFYPFHIFLLGIVCEFRWLVLVLTFILSIAIIVFAALGIKHKRLKALSLILIAVFVIFDCVFSLIFSVIKLKIIETVRALFLLSLCSMCLFDLKRKQSTNDKIQD